MSLISPGATEEINPLIGIPASAKATDAAIKLAHLVPPSACKTCKYTSIVVLGYFSVKTTEVRALLMTIEISFSLREGAGLFLSFTEKVDIL